MWALSTWSASEDLDPRLLMFYQMHYTLSALCGHIYHPFIYHILLYFIHLIFNCPFPLLKPFFQKSKLPFFFCILTIKLLYYYCTVMAPCFWLWQKHLRCSVSAANSEEISGINSTLPATVVPRWHHCTHATIPRCFASAWQEGAWATLQFPVHWPASDVLCSECQLVEIWRKCCC